MAAETGFTIHPGTRLGPVYVKISDLSRALAFYRDVLGLSARPMAEPEEGGAYLSPSLGSALQAGESVTLLTPSGSRGQPLIVLHAVPGARPKPPRSTGLYHFAILVPARLDLAQVL